MTTTKSREKLSRDRIIEAALRIKNHAEGLEAVSMRSRRPRGRGEAMSLYHYVRDKDDLLQGVCDRVMAGFEYPDEDGGLPIHRCKAGARSWRRLLQAHPDVMRPVRRNARPLPHVARFVAPDGVRAQPAPRGRALEWGHRAGVPRVRRPHPGVRDDGGRLDQGVHHDPERADDLASRCPAEAFPVLHAVSPLLRRVQRRRAVRVRGLHLTIRGIAARVGAEAAATTRSY